MAVTSARRRLVANVLCPCCWARFAPNDALFVAADPSLRGDPILGDDEALRFLPTRFTPRGEPIDPGGFVAPQMACPQCHLAIPMDILERLPLIMSLVGMPASGKTYFLAAAMWQMRQMMPRDFGIAFQDTDALLNRPLTANEERLFLSDRPSEEVTLAKTEMEGGSTFAIQTSPGVTSFLPRPFLFTLRPQQGHTNGAAREQLTHLLCLYDNAGEHFLPGADSATAPGTRHVAQARVLMFMYDPLQDPRFRSAIRGVSSDPQLELPIRGMRQDTLLTELAVRIRRALNMMPNERIKRPLFMLLSKSDAWSQIAPDLDLVTEPHLPIPANAANTRDRIGRVDRARVEQTSVRLRDLLARVAPEVVAAAEDAFERVVFIPVSATGSAPRMHAGSGQLGVRPCDLNPHWVTVPFTYALARYAKHFIGTTAHAAADGSTAEGLGDDMDDGDASSNPLDDATLSPAGEGDGFTVPAARVTEEGAARGA